MSASFERNEVLDKLPPHLLDLVISQPYDNYTAQDHAVWRYVMRQNINFLGRVAHQSYLDGLKRTGISIDSIPHMYGMNRILKEIGWAAVAVDGFIPPQAFMEFQAYNVLVIAADIRNINHIQYTPAPDIIHEAAGHAPIIADQEYSNYLKLFGEIGAKAFSSAKDYELYEAIRHLSIVKEDPNSPQDLIDRAEKKIEEIQANMGETSEMALIRNLHWWTVEYGLIGSVEDFKIYGAGLLSSIGESSNCILPAVKKIAYTLDAVNYSFDITTQQPQLFVTPSFEHLSKVLLEFAEGMAFKKGGAFGLGKAIQSANLATIELSSGLQVSGVFSRNYTNANGDVIYFGTGTPTQLACCSKQLEGHSKEYHVHGFSSPVGKLMGSTKALEEFSETELANAGIEMSKKVQLQFESGVEVSGTVEGFTRASKGKIILITFNNCTVTLNGETLFQPEWGTYDMAVGDVVTSAYSGPADALAFGLTFEAPKEKTHKIEYNDKARALHKLYQEVRDMRESQMDNDRLKSIFAEVWEKHSSDWLLPLEILEILRSEGMGGDLAISIESYLQDKASNEESLQKLITDGLGLINNNFELVH